MASAFEVHTQRARWFVWPRLESCDWPKKHQLVSSLLPRFLGTLYSASTYQSGFAPFMRAGSAPSFGPRPPHATGGLDVYRFATTDAPDYVYW